MLPDEPVPEEDGPEEEQRLLRLLAPPSLDTPKDQPPNPLPRSSRRGFRTSRPEHRSGAMLAALIEDRRAARMDASPALRLIEGDQET